MSQYKPYPAYKDSGVEWLGKVPKHWQLQRLKHIANFTGGGTPSRDNPEFWGGDIPWVSPKDMKSEEIAGAEECITAAGLAGSSSSLVPPGRVLMVVRSGILKHTIPVAINSVPVALNQDMKAIWMKSKHSSGRYFMRFVQGLNDFLLNAWLKQGATVESVEQEYLANSLTPAPPQSELDNILEFVDRETTRIDALIEKKTRFIELLREKRQALITHAVTKGLNPNAKMKDSGVEWLGEVPEHWRTMSLARITLSRCDGPFGSAIKSENYTDAGVRVIRLQNIGSSEFKDGDKAFLATEYRDEIIGNSHDVKPGDLLIAGLGDDNNPLGRTCVAPDFIGDAIVKADCYRFRIDKREATPEFLALQLSATARIECGFVSTGSTRERLNLGLAASRFIAIPPSIEEQRTIVETTNIAISRIDSLFNKTERSIELLKERRSALITAAVTGQIDLREAS